MNKKIKFLVISILIIAVGYYFFSSIFLMVLFGHHIEMKKDSQKYLWLLQDSVKAKIDIDFFVGFTKKRDSLYEYPYPGHSLIYIWEFQDLSSAELSNIKINTNVNLEDSRPSSAEAFNLHNPPQFIVKFGGSFGNTMNISLNEYSKISKTIDENNYKGFLGAVNKMAFSNSKGETLVLIDNTGFNAQPTLLLLYKHMKRFYIIIIFTNNQVDDNTLKMLKLAED